MSLYLIHSAKGTSWDEHKCISKKNGTYVYPEDEKGTEEGKESQEKNSKFVLSDSDSSTNKKGKSSSSGKTWKIHKDSNIWGKGKNKSDSKKDDENSKKSSSKNNSETEGDTHKSDEEKALEEQKKMDTKTETSEKTTETSTEKKEMSEEDKAEVQAAQDYIANFNVTYKNKKTDQIPTDRLLKYREAMNTIMSKNK